MIHGRLSSPDVPARSSLAELPAHTERKQFEAQCLNPKLNRRQTGGGVAHEFNNPTAIIARRIDS